LLSKIGEKTTRTEKAFCLSIYSLYCKKTRFDAMLCSNSVNKMSVLTRAAFDLRAAGSPSLH